MKLDFLTPAANKPKPPLFGSSAPAQPEKPQPLFSPEPVESVTLTPAPPAPQVQETGLSTAQQAAVALLPGPAQAAFAEIWKFAPNLTVLLDKGVLDDHDGEKTVVERLHDLSAKPRGAGLDGGDLTLQTINVLADPDSVHQGKAFSCGAANVERQLVETPTFVKIVDDLTSPQGKAPFELQRVPGTEDDDGTGRNDLNRVLQGALMTAANPAYDAVQDTSPTGPGLKPLEIAAVTARAFEEDQAVVIHDGGTHDEFVRIFNQARPGETFQVGASWNGKEHMLLYLGQENGTARFFNADEARAAEMPVADLLFKTQFAIFPEHYMEGAQLPDDAVYWARNEEAKS